MNKKPIIGIVGKPQCDDIIWNKICISNEIKDAVNKNNAIAIGIIPQSQSLEFEEKKPFSYHNYIMDEKSINDLYLTLDICDGIILEGGIVICNYEQEIVKYCIKNNKPILGICCGCINMALATGGKIDFENYDYLKKKHFSLENMEMHVVKIEKDSKLYDLIAVEDFVVNSIHKCKISNPGKYLIKGYSDDNIIELLEYNENGFNIGVQWHPELIQNKKKQNDIFKGFIDYIVKHNKTDKH